MASRALEDVTLELMQANEFLGVIKENTSLTNEFLNLTVDTFKTGFADMIMVMEGNALVNAEDQREQNQFNQKLLEALQNLAPKKEKVVAGTDVPDIQLPSLGKIATGLAIGLAGIAGAVSAWFKTIKYFSKLFTPESMLKAYRSFRVGLEMQMQLFKGAIVEKLTALKGAISGGITKIGEFFGLGKGGKLVSIFSKIKSVIMAITEPFVAVIKMFQPIVSGTMSKVGSIFSKLGGFIKAFASKFSFLTKIFSKIFLPIGIIMTAWDTISAAIDGFKKDGILGGIQGAITGFFTSLITKPLDLIKDAVSWILSKLGFENASGLLDSFSFTELFTKMINSVFTLAKDVVNSIVSYFGFDEGKVPSVSEFVLKLITAPYTLLKNAVAWIAEKLGFDSQAEYLKEFDIAKELTKLWKSITDVVTSSIDWLMSKIPSMDDITNYFKSILTDNVIYKKAIDWGIVDPIDVPGPQVQGIPETPQSPSAQLPDAQRENTQARAASESRPSQPAPSVVSSSVSNTTVNSGTTFVNGSMDPYSGYNYETIMP